MPFPPFGFDLHIPGFFEDVRVSAAASRLGILSKPDFDYTNIGLLFPQDDATEKIYITDQLSHGWKSGSSIYPHIHYIQDEAEVPTFKLDYRFYDNGDTVPDFTTITTTGVPIYTYTSGAILQIIVFPVVELPEYGTSAFYDMILYRDDDVVTGDVLVKGFDFHTLFNSIGSYTQYEKQP